MERWGEEIWANDPYGRNFAGLPPSSSGDYAWVQHMLRSMAPGRGRMAVVLPHGALFRMGAEGKIRRKILEMDLLEAVIGLGPNLFYGTGLAAAILVFRGRKRPERAGQVLFVDGSGLYRRGRNQNTLEPEHAAQILALYRDYRDAPGVAHVATLAEIERNDWNLNIPRYVEPVAAGETITLEAALANLQTSLADAYAAEDRLRELLRMQGLL